MKWLLAITILIPFCVISLVHSTVMQFGTCLDNDDFLEASKNCKINKVEVVGCRKERNAPSECKLRRSENASLSINFTPDFDGDDITVLAYTTVPIEAPWPGMESDACKFMSCPVQKNVETTYNYAMQLTPQYPRGSFSVRVLLRQHGEPKCCFKTRVRIEK